MCFNLIFRTVAERAAKRAAAVRAAARAALHERQWPHGRVCQRQGAQGCRLVPRVRVVFFTIASSHYWFVFLKFVIIFFSPISSISIIAINIYLVIDSIQDLPHDWFVRRIVLLLLYPPTYQISLTGGSTRWSPWLRLRTLCLLATWCLARSSPLARWAKSTGLCLEVLM